MSTSRPDVAAAISALVAALQQQKEPELEPGVRIMLTATEAAEALRCSKSLVYKLTRDGLLPSVKIGQRRLYAAEEINAFLAAGGTSASTET